MSHNPPKSHGMIVTLSLGTIDMKILLIVIGKTDQKWLVDGIGQYAERLTHFAQFEMHEECGI